MYEIYKAMVYKNPIIKFNDIIIFLDAYDEHIATLRMVLQLLLDEKFWLKASKCQFCTKRLDTL